MTAPTPAARLAQRETLAGYCRRLSLSPQAVTLCETEATPKQEAFLVRVFAAALDHRETVRRMRLLQRAGFPVPQSLEDDDRHRVPWPSTLTWADLETGAFIDTHRHLVLYGAVGTGKSHRATALGIRACEQGRAVRFFTVTDLVVRLSEARRAGTVERLLQDLHRTELLVLDEWGCAP